MKVVVGLGNPGISYAYNRHNIGYIMLDALRQDLSLEYERNGSMSVCKAEDFLLLITGTYMNVSGGVVHAVAQKYGVSISDIIVLYDDVNLPPGVFKIKHGGSDGGHNGIASIIEAFNSDDFTRVRIGVGRPPQGSVLADWVLSDLTEDELSLIMANAEDIVGAVKIAVIDSYSEAMRRYNKRIVRGE